VQREATACIDIWIKFSPPLLPLCAIHADEKAWYHSTGDWKMKILLYNPDNGVTRNFMPHLWMFLLQALTPPAHEVVLIDANARPMSDDEIVQFVSEQKIELVGIGAMTRMIEKAYRRDSPCRRARCNGRSTRY
jgi:hypothetical protein